MTPATLAILLIPLRRQSHIAHRGIMTEDTDLEPRLDRVSNLFQTRILSLDLEIRVFDISIRSGETDSRFFDRFAAIESSSRGCREASMIAHRNHMQASIDPRRSTDRSDLTDITRPDDDDKCIGGTDRHGRARTNRGRDDI